MIKPWHLLPVLAASALAASAYWWQAEKDRWTPPAPLKPDLPKVEPLPQHERMRARQALERPVFWTARRPVEVDDKKNSLARELTQSRLSAVFESGRDRVAILQRPDGSTLKITADTNVLVRALVRDDPQQAQTATDALLSASLVAVALRATRPIQ